MAAQIKPFSGEATFRIAGISLGVLMIVAAAAGIALEVKSLPQHILAAEIKDGARPDWTFFQTFEKEHGTGGFADVCFSDLAHTTAAIRLAALDAAQKTPDPANSDAALSGAADSLRASLSCNPLDGEAWLSLAVVEMQRMGPVPAVVSMVELSYWTTPNEMQVVADRIRFVSRLYDAGLANVAPMLEHDIRTMANWGHADEFRSLRQGASAKAAGFYDAALSALPAERRKILENE